MNLSLVHLVKENPLHFWGLCTEEVDHKKSYLVLRREFNGNRSLDTVSVLQFYYSSINIYNVEHS